MNTIYLFSQINIGIKEHQNICASHNKSLTFYVGWDNARVDKLNWVIFLEGNCASLRSAGLIHKVVGQRWEMQSNGRR